MCSVTFARTDRMRRVCWGTDLLRGRRTTLAMLLVMTSAFGACSAGELADDRAGMLAALAIIDGSGFHALSERLTGPNPAIDPSDLGHVRHARIAAASVTWPDEIRKKSQAFEATTEVLADALERDNVAAAAKAVLEAHAAYHALSDAGWEYLADRAGVPSR